MTNVFIIESPGALDNLQGRNEREPLEAVLKAIGLQAESYNVREADDFTDKFVEITRKLKSMPAPIHPIIHISAHGTKDGIVLTNRDVVSWSNLARLLAPLNQICDDMLFVAMSACHGYHAFEMACDFKEPYRCLVGPLGEPSWEDTLLGYSILYHLLAKRRGTNMSELISRMNTAVGVDNCFGAVIRTENIEKMALTSRKLSEMDPHALRDLMLRAIQQIKDKPASKKIAEASE